jgi:uncharacterized protein YyaL (SSP411 family)
MKSILRQGLACAALGLLSVTAHAGYREKAEAQTAFIQDHFWDPQAKMYRDAFPPKPGGLPFTTMWPNGVEWTVLVSATKYDPAQYRPFLYAFREGMAKYWDSQPKGSPPGFNAYCSGPGGTDKYYDDNAWLALGFVEAYDVTHDPRFLQSARDTQNFVLSGWDNTLGGGVFWSLSHKSKNTCSNAPTAAAALRLYQADGDRTQLDWAEKIRTWTNSKLEDTDGLYWDNVNVAGNVQKTKWTYNTALMIRTDVLLFQAKKDAAYLRSAERSADAAISTWQDPKTGAFADNALFSHLLCEALLRLYDVDHDVRYLNAVRRHAAYGDRAVRDAENGGYWSDWHHHGEKREERKSLIENAADARLLWLLTPYPDVDELYQSGIKAATENRYAQAEELFRQAAGSDVEAVEAHFRLLHVLQHEKKLDPAAKEMDILTEMAKNPVLRKRLDAVGWSRAAAFPMSALPPS